MTLRLLRSCSASAPVLAVAGFALASCLLSAGCSAGSGGGLLGIAASAASRASEPTVPAQVDRFRRALLKKMGSRLGKGGEEAVDTFQRAMRATAFSSVEPVSPLLLGDAAVRSLDSELAGQAETPEDYVDLAIAAMMQAGDPDGSYVRQARAQPEVQGPPAKPGGVGLELKVLGGALTVVAAVPGAPAARAGIVAGDHILAVNGQGTAGLDLMEAVELLRGDVGSPVTLTVDRRGEDTQMVTLERVVVQMRSVTLARTEAGCAVVRVSQFAEDTEEMLAGLLADASGTPGIVLDLRSNGGGLMSSVVASADLFLETGRIAKVSARGSATPVVYAARPGGPATRVPLVVLVDGETAAGAEIFAAALRDNGRARIAGHGTIQTAVPLGNDATLMLTTSKVSTAGGQPVSAGVAPDLGGDATTLTGPGDPAMEKALDLVGCGDGSREEYATTRERTVERDETVEDGAATAGEDSAGEAPAARPEPGIGSMPPRRPAPKAEAKPAPVPRATPHTNPAAKPPVRPVPKPGQKPVDDSDNGPADI